MSTDTPGHLPEGFRRYRTRASILVHSTDELKALVGRAARKLVDAGAVSEKFAAARGQLASLLALLKAYASGEYRNVSTHSLISIVAGVVYFVVPVDLIPDFILGLGLADDAAVIGYVFSIVRTEVRDFEAWVACDRKSSVGKEGQGADR